VDVLIRTSALTLTLLLGAGCARDYDHFFVDAGNADLAGADLRSPPRCSSTNGWQPYAYKLPQARTNGAATVIGDTIFYLGGYDDTAMPRDEVWVMTPPGDWQQVTSLPTPRAQFSATTLDGKIYVASGHGGTPPSDLQDLWVFDPTQKTWSQLQQPLEPHASHQLVTGSDGRLYLIDTQSEVYDEGSWSALADPTHPRDSGAAVARGDTIYYVGGYSGSAILDVDLLATSSDEWTSGTALPSPGRSSAAGTLDANGNVLVIGGTAESVTTTEVFDGTQWMAGPTLPYPSYASSAVSTSDGQTYYMGGQGNGVALTNVYTYCP
jgi:N-acetylneuraminic acid mutarotase